MRALRTAITFLFVFALAQGASADQILFSNLGLNGSYDLQRATFFGFTETQTDPAENGARAMPFTPAVTAALTSLRLPLQFPWFSHDWFDGGTLQINLFDSSGGLPGQILESWTSNGTHTSDTLSVFSSVLAPQLIGGAGYFIEARAIGEANGLWHLTATPDHAPVPDVARRGDGPWLTGGVRRFTAAFEVSGEPVAPTPEPGTLILLGTGVALGAWRRRRRTAG